MTASTTLPWEDLNGVGGWFLYISLGVLLLGAIARIGYLAIRYWVASFKLILAKRKSGGRDLGKWWEKALGVGMVLVLALLTVIFIRLFVIQVVQVVRFNDSQMELIYRFPWLNKSIPYASILKVTLTDDLPAVALLGAHPRSEFPLKIVITTQDRTYEIADGATSMRSEAKAIYAEIERHTSKLADLP